LEYSHGEEGTLAGGTGPCRQRQEGQPDHPRPGARYPRASPLRDGLQKALKRGKPIVLDAAQVDRLSTPCIQVLLAAGKSAEAAAGRIVLAQASDAFVAAFSDLGLFANLMSWQAEA